jgi:hypothetical protein
MATRRSTMATALILANEMERVLADIDADYGGEVSSSWDMACFLSLVACCQHSLLARISHTTD